MPNKSSTTTTSRGRGKRGADATTDGVRASKRPAAASTTTTKKPPSPHHQQRRLWVKDRSRAWWDQCNSAEFPESEFRAAFRMGRATFAALCDALAGAVAKEDTALRAAIPVRQRVAVCVWRLATGEPLRLVSKRFGLGISTCHKLVLEVCAAIRGVLMPRHLRWPDAAAAADFKARFEAATGIPGVVGAIHTAHVPIIAPKSSVAAYLNRRHTQRACYTVTMQGVVGPDGAFTDVCIGWPGAMPDAQVLERSALQQRAAAGEIMAGGCWVVGGASFPLTDWLLPPYASNSSSSSSSKGLTWAQHAFNEKAADARRVAVDAFARLKARWACLQKRTEVKLQDLPVVLGACCVLHNLCESRGEHMDPALLLARCDLDLDLDDDDGPQPPDNPVRSDSASKARDEIAHSLLHRGIAGTKFF
ncbi:hypothetical protein U9M48_045057 [Paspalum notatum var. saurae]|uniref:DDE Tnp4 domain-containing protein n=1 Tax=Paspalum notatum var. saurae TaxID=547442 RepID=A0AAQ3UWA8_PASNO